MIKLGCNSLVRDRDNPGQWIDIETSIFSLIGDFVLWIRAIFAASIPLPKRSIESLNVGLQMSRLASCSLPLKTSRIASQSYPLMGRRWCKSLLLLHKLMLPYPVIHSSRNLCVCLQSSIQN